MLKSVQLGENELQQEIREFFQERGIEPERIKLFGQRNLSNHLSLYQEIDIALDTYPYQGVTTTMEALVMGVPVLSWRGNRTASRTGWSSYPI